MCAAKLREWMPNAGRRWWRFREQRKPADAVVVPDQCAVREIAARNTLGASAPGDEVAVDPLYSASDTGDGRRTIHNGPFSRSFLRDQKRDTFLARRANGSPSEF